MADTTNIVATNKPNALDYYNAGVNTYNAYTNQKTLEATRDLYGEFAKIATLEEQKQKREQLLAQLRQFVFERETILERIMPFTATAPIPAHIATIIVQRSFRYVGIDPTVFPEFVDKDRIRKVLQFISDIAGEAQKAFSVGQENRARRCVEYLDAQPALTEIIELTKQKAEYDRLQSELTERLAKVKERLRGTVLWHNRIEKLFVPSVIIGLALLLLAIFAGKVLDNTWLFDGAMLTCLGWLGIFISLALVAYFLQQRLAGNPEVVEIARLRKQPSPDEARLQLLSEQYAPNMSLEDVIRLKSEREEYITKHMFYDNNGSPLPSDLIENLKNIL